MSESHELSPFERMLVFYTKAALEILKNSEKSKFLEPYKKDKKIDLDESQVFYIRPIAEVLAMLDGNAFFGTGSSDPEDADGEWWMQYAADAIVLWEANGGVNGWAGLSFLGDIIKHENEQVKEAFENWLMLKKISRSQKNVSNK